MNPIDGVSGLPECEESREQRKLDETIKDFFFKDLYEFEEWARRNEREKILKLIKEMFYDHMVDDDEIFTINLGLLKEKLQKEELSKG